MFLFKKYLHNQTTKFFNFLTFLDADCRKIVFCCHLSTSSVFVLCFHAKFHAHFPKQVTDMTKRLWSTSKSKLRDYCTYILRLVYVLCFYVFLIFNLHVLWVMLSLFGQFLGATLSNKQKVAKIVASLVLFT